MKHLIVGAGATLAEAIALGNSPDVCPPLIRDFARNTWSNYTPHPVLEAYLRELGHSDLGHDPRELFFELEESGAADIERFMEFAWANRDRQWQVDTTRLPPGYISGLRLAAAESSSVGVRPDDSGSFWENLLYHGIGPCHCDDPVLLRERKGAFQSTFGRIWHRTCLLQRPSAACATQLSGQSVGQRGDARWEAPTMIRGSCLCRGVQFEATEIPLIVLCHCSNCRKANGAPFESGAAVPSTNFKLTKGGDLVQVYESSPGTRRAFCRVCGSRAPSRSADGRLYFVPAGLLDDDPGVKPAVHMFVGSKASWWEITDDLPQFEQWVPGYSPEDSK